MDLSTGSNDILDITLPDLTSGTGYVLTIDGVDTDEIAWDARTRDVSRAIEKALELSYGQLIVTQTEDGFSVEFGGLYSGQSVITTVSAGNSASASLSQQGSQVLDTLISFGAEDYIDLEGGVGADDVDLSEFAGNSKISTLQGSDTIRVAQGTNIVDAGDGDDFIYITGESNDIIVGGEGEDTLIADMSDATGADHTFDLDNDELVTDLATINLLGIESAELIGSDGADTFNASDFIAFLKLRTCSCWMVGLNWMSSS